MAAVWDNGPEGQGEMIVMLALADWCNDDGECWPSMAGLAKKARLSDERSARRIVRRLEESGWIEISVGGGRHGCNQYRLKVGHTVPHKPGHKVPRTESPPDPERKKPGLSMPKTRTVEPPEPSRTIIEPSDIARETVESVLGEVASRTPIASFIAFRRKTKGKALTVTAAKRLAKHLAAIKAKGGDPDDALGMAEERGWLTVEPDWYFRNRPQAPPPPSDARIAKWKKIAGDAA